MSANNDQRAGHSLKRATYICQWNQREHICRVDFVAKHPDNGTLFSGAWWHTIVSRPTDGSVVD
ncbi:hypothetical protein PISMIDRAFT_16445 [Pisolithus microcarpus 441]|uniref:Unplaced genomic scaffold scaffold_203, whole genome shotgun sequence n=1 Tax=Pisolithus microcarpus 441 TaxID=765257 RepID=A0A0C9YZN2_9AGAM|nr:hypothetical protein PISMIDRAFT_16445 [Pisolithus microcarpus 441]